MTQSGPGTTPHGSLTEALRWEIGVLIGPCDQEDAEWLMQKVAEVVQGRLGAVVSLGPWDEKA